MTWRIAAAECNSFDKSSEDPNQGGPQRGGPGRDLVLTADATKVATATPQQVAKVLRSTSCRYVNGFSASRNAGVWRILSGIAALDETPRSLAEFDEALGLKANKMRSTKAIFAKLENRFDIRFLVAG